MDRNAVWKWLVLIALVCGSLALIYPPSEKVTLGLDLKGGTSFVVEIDKEQLGNEVRGKNPDLTAAELTKRVNEDAARGREMAVEIIRNRVDGLGIAEPIIYSATYRDQERIIVQLPGVDAEKRKAARESIESVAYLEFRLVSLKSDQWTKELLASGKSPVGFRLSEQGPYYVRDKSLLSDEKMDRDYFAKLRKFQPHPGSEFMLEKTQDSNGRVMYRPYYVEIRPLMKGDAIASASVDYNQMTHAPYVSIVLNSEGADRFARITADYAPMGPRNSSSEGRQLGIVLDGTLYSAPSINEEIPSGRAQITGRFTPKDAMKLANVLNTGSLPVPVKIVQTQTVDPSLGQDSINSGAKSAIIALLAVIAFMGIYYLKAGLVANMALIIEMLLFPLALVISAGFMGLIAGHSGGYSGSAARLPTLTLPGIAGIALTIGMAVDANVLIFERIREELRTGKRLLPAIEAGYDKAFSTIFDANITTLLTAVILFTFGSGPIKGFAVTLTAGIIVSMFVALIYTRLLFEFLVEKMNMTSLNMMSIVGQTTINFVGMRFVAIGISALVLVGTWGVFFAKGADTNFGVDFTGGTSLVYRFDDRQSVEDVRETLAAAGIKDAAIQYQSELVADGDGNNEYLEIRVGEDDGELVKTAMESSFAKYGYRVNKEDQVRGQVGAELRRKGLMAIIWASVGIVIYITIRFEWSFALGAICATFHDVLVTAGIFCLLGHQITLPVVAALLTIVGYSVNDTIVVFDRIREDIKLLKGRSLKEIANLSVNQTLSRTILTSLTTLLSVAVLLIFGGGAIKDFALTLFIGIVVGTFSSIFIATPVVLFLRHEDSDGKENKQ